MIIIFGRNFLFEKFFIENDIFYVSHTSFLGKNSKIKSFPWFPDFQEYYLPQYFSKKKVLLRKLNLYLASHHANKIIVSSKSVYDDLSKISIKAIKKTRILRHNNSLISRNNLLSKNFLQKKFNIKKNFFLVPNHYWKHKNHLCLLKALTKLKNKDITVISTGRCEDHRNLNYFLDIKKFIFRNNLSKNYKILGLVNYNELVSLMYYSSAVINPSKFEGWGNSASMALSIGKPVIVSNIKVHRELKGKSIYYFNPNNPTQLSRILKYLSKRKKNKHNFNKFIKNNDSKTQEYIKSFIEILNES
ncbi:glycosyltransferase [Candidatus Pelagibacter sp.]|nr:glycosyltransferase [Candidatus Pelagibacter sp.]